MFTVVGEASDGLSAIELAHHLVPEVVTMDLRMPRLGGVEATRRIKAALPHIHVIGLTSHADRCFQEAMAEAGCSAFIPKHCAATLPRIIAQVTGRVVDPALVGKDTF
jgi:DNA-binding NarL/FixJ family response regulator